MIYWQSMLRWTQCAACKRHVRSIPPFNATSARREQHQHSASKMVHVVRMCAIACSSEQGTLRPLWSSNHTTAALHYDKPCAHPEVPMHRRTSVPFIVLTPLPPTHTHLQMCTSHALPNPAHTCACVHRISLNAYCTFASPVNFGTHT